MTVERRTRRALTLVIAIGTLAACFPSPAHAAPKLKWRVTSVTGFLFATAEAGYARGNSPCNGLYNGYVGGTKNKAGFHEGGDYAGRVGKTSGTLSGASGNGDLHAKVKITYEQYGSVVCATNNVKTCDDTLTTTLDMNLSIRGRKLYWDPGGERPDLPGLARVAVVPPFVCAFGADEARVDWEFPAARNVCPATAPSLAGLGHRTTLTIKLKCQVKGELISPQGRPSYGFKASYPFTGADRNYFRIGEPVLAEHRATIKLVRST